MMWFPLSLLLLFVSVDATVLCYSGSHTGTPAFSLNKVSLGSHPEQAQCAITIETKGCPDDNNSALEHASISVRHHETPVATNDYDKNGCNKTDEIGTYMCTCRHTYAEPCNSVEFVLNSILKFLSNETKAICARKILFKRMYSGEEDVDMLVFENKSTNGDEKRSVENKINETKPIHLRRLISDADIDYYLGSIRAWGEFMTILTLACLYVFTLYLIYSTVFLY